MTICRRHRRVCELLLVRAWCVIVILALVLFPSHLVYFHLLRDAPRVMEEVRASRAEEEAVDLAVRA